MPPCETVSDVHISENGDFYRIVSYSEGNVVVAAL